MAWYSRSLHEAVVNDKQEDMQRLISEGEDVNGQDGSNRTPLDYCVSLHACYEHAEEGREDGECAAKVIT